MDLDIGVVIPTYNRPVETLAAVNSVRSQTVKVKKIVVVDDGSDIDKYRILKESLTGDDVNLLKISPSRHPGVARKAGIEFLKTKWIAFLDSDDIWDSDKLKIQFQIIANEKVRAICSNAYVNTANEGTLFLNMENGKIKLNELINSNKIINSSVVIERELLLKVGTYANSYLVRGAEDYATWLRIGTLTDWYQIAKPLLVYKINSTDSIRTDEDFKHDYVQQIGLLDFQSWLEYKELTRKKLIRVYLLGLKLMIKIAMKVK